ncbi:MAG: extracellular solute-binding protein [Anaerolineaceae bacterium]|nr:extracellular solute-binding protein [Anaerolineaceae bacterium]
MKRSSSFSATILIFFSIFGLLLAACGPLDSTQPTPTPRNRRATATYVPTPTGTPAPYLGVDLAKLNNIQIHFLHPWTGARAQVISDLVNQFNQTNQWGIFVTQNSPGSPRMLFDALIRSTASEDLPDLVATSPQDLLAWQGANQKLVDLSGYLTHPKAGMTQAEMDDFLPELWSQDVDKAVRYGIPAGGDMQVLFYNQTWAKQLGFSTPPTKIDDFEKQICAAAKANENITGGWIINTNPEVILNWMYAYSTEGFFDPGSGRYAFNSPAGVDAFTFLRKMLDTNCAWNSRNIEPYDYFAGRETMIYSGTLLDLIPQASAMQRLENKDDWQIIAYPGKEISSTLITSVSFAIPETTAEKQMAAWLFTRWLSAPDVQARLAVADGTLPPGRLALDNMKVFLTKYPQLQQAFKLLESSRSQPAAESWREARLILQDAAWSLLQPLPEKTTDQITMSERIEQTLRELDATVKEVLGKEE